MQENEPLRDFMKQSISPNTPFFESLTKKPPTSMDDLFRRADKYAMLEDDLPKFRLPEPIKTNLDSLVITLGVKGFDVHKILVDPRSSADLLQMSTYRQMGYSPFALENPSLSLGDVILPIQASPVTLNVRFSIVEELSPYNTIMGWCNISEVDNKNLQTFNGMNNGGTSNDNFDKSTIEGHLAQARSI
ncbi:hypothetical protein AAG906_041088 [Vitis piasezkii]